MLLKISQNPKENTCARVPFSIKLQTLACNCIKKFSGFCKIFKNNFFYRTSPVAASEDYFSSHQRNIVREYKLHGKPTMKQKQIFSLVTDVDIEKPVF